MATQVETYEVTMPDKNCISYWLPKVEATGVPSPRTTLIHTKCELWRMVDGEDVPGLDGFIDEVIGAASAMGLPCFLRSGHTARKHSWRSSCFLDDISPKLVKRHIYQIVEFSELASIACGLPSACWAIRELLPVESIARLERYGMMPVVPEIRFFIAGGNVTAWQPYWPLRAIAEGINRTSSVGDLLDIHDQLAWEAKPSAESLAIVKAVAGAFADDEPFSVDLLKTVNGWFVTDMALAERSFKDRGTYLEFSKEATVADLTRTRNP